MKRRSASPSPKKTNTGGRSRPSAPSATRGAKDAATKPSLSAKAANGGSRKGKPPPKAVPAARTEERGKPSASRGSSSLVSKPENASAGKAVLPRVEKAVASGNGKSKAPRELAPLTRDGRSTTAAPKNRAPRAGDAERDFARRSPLLAHADFQNPPLKKPLEKTVLGAEYRAVLRGPLRDSGLPRRLAHGAVLPALLGDGRMGQLREQIDWAIEDRVPAFYIAESLLQSYLFVGFPRVINALVLLHEVTQQRRRSLGLAADSLHVQTEIPSFDRILGGPTDFGQGLRGRRIRLAEGPPMHLEGPGEGPGSFERYAREWWRRGSELCATVYGSQYERLRENLTRIHPELADWMLFEGYGKVLGRPILTPRERELWIVPLLMVQDVPEQFFSHLRGALHLDVPAARLGGVVWLASLVAGPAALKEALDKIVELERRIEDRRRERP